jgi:tripartite-type tricarboxylate transporter receptor subunit TctC
MRISAVAAGGILALWTTAVVAQQAPYPSRPVRLMVGNPAGTAPDSVARLLGAKLAESWGQQVVVDNRPGATGLIAAETVARATPDGYTLWLPTMTHLISTLQAQRYLLSTDFAPVTLVASTPMVLVVNASIPVRSVAELIAYAKARPGKLTYGSAGPWGSPHLCMESLKSITGIDLLHVPYQGSPQALIDLMAGRIDVSCVAAPGLLPAFVQSGKMRSLGVTFLKPTRLVAGVPPIAETVPGFQLIGWYGLMAPLKLPKPLIAKINADVEKALKTPELQEKLTALGAEATPATPETFGAFLQKETARWEKTLRQLGGIQ